MAAEQEGYANGECYAADSCVLDKNCPFVLTCQLAEEDDDG